MCDPVTIGIASTVISAGGALMQGRAQQQAADASARVAQQNAELARQQADEVQRQKMREQTILNQNRTQMQSQQRVAMAGSGVTTDYGSGLSLLQDTQLKSQQDSDNMEWNAARGEWQQRAQANDYDNQASSLKAQGQNAMTAGILNAATTVGMGAYNMMGGVGGKAKASDSKQFSFDNLYTPVSSKWTIKGSKASDYFSGFKR